MRFCGGIFGAVLLLAVLAADIQPATARIFFNNNEVKFQTAVMRNDETLYAPLRELARGLAMELTYNSAQDIYTVRRAADARSVAFRLNSRTVQVNGRDDELNEPILLVKNSFYAPLNDFLWLFGYFVERDSQANYYIVSRLNTVDWAVRTLTLRGEAPLNVELSRTAEGYLLLVRNSILGVAPREIEPDGVITAVEYAQRSLNPGLVQILLRTKDFPQYTAARDDLANTYTLRFDYQARPAPEPVAPVISAAPADNQIAVPAGHARIYAFTQENLSGGRRFVLHASERLRPDQIKYLVNPPRAFIDIPKSYYTATLNILRANDQYVQTVRAAQFDRGVVRVVADLSDAQTKPDVYLSEDGRQMILSFGSPSIASSPPPVRAPEPAPPPVANTQTLKGLRVAVIVGHGGNDPGAISRQGYMEKHLTLELAKKLQTALQEKGAIPLLSREDDRNISLDAQAEFAQKQKADVLISLHLNNFINDSTSGSESFYYKPVDYDFAKCIHEELVKQIQLKDRGLRKAMMHNLNHTTMPGVLLEPLFLSNRREENLIKSADFQWKMMRAVVAGLENYQKLKKK